MIGDAEREKRSFSREPEPTNHFVAVGSVIVNCHHQHITVEILFYTPAWELRGSGRVSVYVLQVIGHRCSIWLVIGAIKMRSNWGHYWIDFQSIQDRSFENVFTLV